MKYFPSGEYVVYGEGRAAETGIVVDLKDLW